MRRIYSAFIASVVLASTPSLAADDDSVQERFPKSALLKGLADGVFQPQVQQFARQSQTWAQDWQHYCQHPSAKGWKQLQQGWLATARQWQALEMVQIGPLIERRSQREVNFWPTRPAQIDNWLKSHDALSADALETLPAAAKGLPALEYLMSLKPAPKGRRCAVATWLARGVAQEAAGLEQDWRQGYTRQLAEAGQHPEDKVFLRTDQALGELINLMIAGMDFVRVRKLEKPLQHNRDEQDALDRIEAWRSGHSLSLLEANLDGFSRVFFGMDGPGGKAVGFDDYLDGRDKLVLIRRTKEDLEEARAILRNLKGKTMQQAIQRHPAQLEALQTILRRLQTRLENELAPLLDIQLDFNASDGD